VTSTGPASSDLRYVAFADVLGFRSLVQNTPHGQLMNLYQGTLQMAADFAASGGRSRPPTDPNHDPLPEVELATVNMRVISDSVLMWTDDDNSAEFVALIMAATGLLAAGMASGIPMRAAIAWGAATPVHRRYDTPRLGVESLVGQALVDAYNGEQTQCWSGGYVLPSAMNRYQQMSGPAAPTLPRLREAGWLFPCSIPLVTGSEHGWALNWTRPLSDSSDEMIRQMFREWGKGEPPANKVENTVAFARTAQHR
jgi:hypothetical protein